VSLSDPVTRTELGDTPPGQKIVELGMSRVSGRIDLAQSGIAVYRIYSAADNLLYVGQTNSIINRMREHGQNSGWYCMASYVEWEEFPTRAKASREESRLISALAPPYNVMLTSQVIERVVHGPELDRPRPWFSVAERIEGTR
jgi:predicted GIY-YIG superfamily endonuclease